MTSEQVRDAAAIVFFLVGGLASGVLAKLGDEAGPDWASEIGTQPALWIFVNVVIGYAAPRSRSAATRAASYFVGVCTGYYAWTSIVLDYPVPQAAFGWSLAAVGLCPVIAALTVLLRRTSPLASAFWLGGCGGLVLVTSGLRRTWLTLTGQMGTDVAAPTTAAAILVILAAWLGLLARRPLWVVLTWAISVLVFLLVPDVAGAEDLLPISAADRTAARCQPGGSPARATAC